MKVRALFDFQAQPGSSELELYKDDILIVTNKEIGDGWWEGRNARGEMGLFPICYVEEIDETSSINAQQPSQQVAAATSSFLSQNQTSQFKSPDSKASEHQAEEPDWPDEDWDDDDDSGDNATDYGPQGSQRGYPAGTPYYGSTNQKAGAHDLSVATTNLSIADNRHPASGGAVKPKKNLNRFSNFVKSGLQCYLLEAKAIHVPQKVEIISDPELGMIWKSTINHHTCAVTKHGKETKMKGLKTYISYDITPSQSNVGVRRRYKHFDWLLQRLEEKFIVTPMPPLPEKQIAGRFQEDFVEHRRNLLQLWVNYITRHPILSQCDVWWHFITCSTDDNKGWKNGKRKAEKDELVGANFFYSIDVTHPSITPLEPIKTAKQIDNFQRFVSKLDEAVKHMFTTAIDQSKKVSTVYAKDYKKLSESIKGLSSAFQSGTAWRNSLGLNEAIRQTSAAYEEISRFHESGPKYDFEPMADILHQYRGLLSGWPEILQLHKNTVNTRNDQERLLEEGKISADELTKVNQRADVVTYATLAEINHFHNERLVDFKQMMQVFLTAQINFHSDILGKLQSALNKINDA